MLFPNDNCRLNEQVREVIAINTMIRLPAKFHGKSRNYEVNITANKYF